MKKQVLVPLAKYGVGLALLTWVVWKNWNPPGAPGIAAALGKPVQVTPLIVAILLYLIGVLITWVRWYFLVRAQDLPFTLWNAFRLGMVGFFLSTFLPGAVGGDIVKAAFLAKDQSRRTVAVATVILDRVVGLWGLFWLVSIVGSLFWLAGDPSLHGSRSLQIVLALSLAVVAASVIAWILMGLLPDWRAQRFAGRLSRIPKVGHSAAEFWRAIWLYRCKSASIGGALGLSLLAQIPMVVGFFFAAQVFLQPQAGETIPTLAQHFVFVPIGLVVEAVPGPPGGAGIGELGFGTLYKLVQGTDEAETRGVMACLVKRLIGWGLGAVGYIFYLVMKPSIPTEADAGFFESRAKADLGLQNDKATTC